MPLFRSEPRRPASEFIGFKEAIRRGDIGGSVEHFDTADLKDTEVMRKEWEPSYLAKKGAVRCTAPLANRLSTVRS
jgi:hypothetical protein